MQIHVQWQIYDVSWIVDLPPMPGTTISTSSHVDLGFVPHMASLSLYTSRKAKASETDLSVRKCSRNCLHNELELSAGIARMQLLVERIQSENRSTNRRVRAVEMMSLRPTSLSSHLLCDVHIFTRSVST